MEFQEQTVYRHSLSTKVFTTKSACSNDYNKLLKKKEEEEEKLKKRSDVRLSVEHIDEIEPALVKHFTEFGIDLQFNNRINTLRFCEISTTHNAPLGKSPDCWGNSSRCCGWRGAVQGKVSWIDKKCKKPISFGSSFDGIFDTGSKYVEGFHTGTGRSGSDFHIEFYFFIEDFPKIYTKYLEYKAFAAREGLFKKQYQILRRNLCSNIALYNDQFLILKQVNDSLNDKITEITEQVNSNNVKMEKIVSDICQKTLPKFNEQTKLDWKMFI